MGKRIIIRESAKAEVVEETKTNSKGKFEITVKPETSEALRKERSSLETLEKAYVSLIERYKKNSKMQTDVTALDSLSEGYLYHRGQGTAFNDLEHATKTLALWATKRRIRVENQQRRGLVSMSKAEVCSAVDSIHFSLNPLEASKGHDLSLFKWILQQRDSKKKYRFSRVEMQVLAKRYLSGKTFEQIGVELGKDKSTISRINDRIEKKIIDHVPLKDKVSEFGYKASQVGRLQWPSFLVGDKSAIRGNGKAVEEIPGLSYSLPEGHTPKADYTFTQGKAPDLFRVTETQRRKHSGQIRYMFGNQKDNWATNMDASRRFWMQGQA